MKSKHCYCSPSFAETGYYNAEMVQIFVEFRCDTDYSGFSSHHLLQKIGNIQLLPRCRENQGGIVMQRPHSS